VGLVRLSGPRALQLLQQACSMQRVVPRQMHGVRLLDPSGEVIDRAMVCYMPGPRSYTGEDVVEVFGHGGVLNMERILALFLRAGTRLAGPGEFTRRAFLNGRLDLTQAEAVAQVVAARSERALRNAQAVLDGALGQQLAALRRQVVQLCALLEAELDFADDSQGEVSPSELAQRHQQLEQTLSDLVGSYRAGRRLDGVSVALVGPVNAGKSSLFNRLLQCERAIVAEEPGTTRDYLEAETIWRGQRVRLIDTAGERLEGTLGAMELAGQALAAPVLGQCDLLVHVLDLSRPDEVRHVQQGAPLLIAANKVDLIASTSRAAGLDQLTDCALVVPTSAVTGEGLGLLREQVMKLLFPDDGLEPETIQLFRQRQWEALLRAREAVTAGRLAQQQGLPPELMVEHAREALRRLDEVTGQGCTEAVLDAVFERFCVGK